MSVMPDTSTGDNATPKLTALPLFAIIFLIAASLLFMAALAHYWQVTLKEQTDFKNNEISLVNRGKTAIEQQLAGVVSDINYLAAYGEHYQIRDGKAYSLFDDDITQNHALTTLLKVFSQEKQVYDQIRFIDTLGAEKLRINYDQGRPQQVAEVDLQKKSSRYYIKEIRRLRKGELYISPLDLNIEKGIIERPFKPVLRFGKLVYNAEGELKGSLLLNFKGGTLIDAFKQATKFSDAHISLLNKDGYWLSSPDIDQEWHFMFDNPQSFASKFPEAWDIIRNKLNGQFETRSHLITYTTVSPLPRSLAGRSTPNWKIVSSVPQSHAALAGAFDKYFSLYGFVLMLLGVGSWLLASAITRHRQSELQVAFEQRFRQVLEHVDLLAIGLDHQGKITFCNDALANLTGWRREDMLGQDWFEKCVANDYREAAQQTLFDLKSGAIESIHEDARLKTREGKTLRVEWNHTLMKDTDGGIIGVTCIGENVTEIRAQEKQILTLSRAVEQSPAAVLIVGTDGGIQYVNPQFSNATGYTLDEVKGRDPAILRSDPETDPDKYAELWKTIEAGETWHGVFKNKKKNGEIYWASASISGLRDHSGKISNYIGVQEDITERLSLERKFRMSVEGAPYAMVMVDETGEILLVNSRTEEYFGYQRDELIGEKVEVLLPNQYQSGHVGIREHYFAQSNESGSDVTSDSLRREHGAGRTLSGMRKDGSLFPVEIALNRIDTEDGKITLASIVDITQRTELEVELQQRNQEIEKSKTLAIVGKMASMVAHDLRNPLSSIKMGLQILRRPSRPGNEQQSQELKTIALEQVSYMEAILEDLLNYARPPALKPEWIDMRTVLDETINMLQGKIHEYKAKVQTEVQTGLPTIYADPGKLRQIFSNLISNAIHAASEFEQEPRVGIEVMFRLGGKVPTILVEITDNGPGIDADKITQLFEPFYTTRAKGSGLGLAIVKGFVEQHLGKISLKSRVDHHGAICIVELPVSELITQPAHSKEK